MPIILISTYSCIIHVYSTKGILRNLRSIHVRSTKCHFIADTPKMATQVQCTCILIIIIENNNLRFHFLVDTPKMATHFQWYVYYNNDN